MFSYDVKKIDSVLQDVIRTTISGEQWNWLQESAKAVRDGNVAQLNATFAAMPRKTGKKNIIVSEQQQQAAQQAKPGILIRQWTVDRLCRIWLLLQIPPIEKNTYQETIENLFNGAEMNELVALYSALPLLAFPESWKLRCAEGIRSNIGLVLESIMCDNPYPSEYLEEPAWNQLVLKAFFTEKPVHRIIGLDQRANANLAKILSDYAHERWAAYRPVHPQLWRCVAKFINETIYPDIERIAFSEKTIDRQAAALACAQSSYLPARELVQKNAYLKSIVEEGTLTWNKLAEQATAVTS